MERNKTALCSVDRAGEWPFLPSGTHLRSHYCSARLWGREYREIHAWVLAFSARLCLDSRAKTFKAASSFLIAML